MIAPVVNDHLEVHHLVAGKIAVLRRFLDALVDGGDIFLGNRAADRRILERIARARFLRKEVNLPPD